MEIGSFGKMWLQVLDGADLFAVWNAIGAVIHLHAYSRLTKGRCIVFAPEITSLEASLMLVLVFKRDAFHF